MLFYTAMYFCKEPSIYWKIFFIFSIHKFRKSKRARKSADNDDDYVPSDEKEELGSEDEQPKQEEDSDRVPPIEQNLAGILELAKQQITEGDREG